MATKTVKTNNTTFPKLLESILKEVRQLRDEVRLLFPQEDLSEYSNSERIKKSYQNALKKHPPA